jgi:hypothetical protein
LTTTAKNVEDIINIRINQSHTDAIVSETSKTVAETSKTVAGHVAQVIWR